MSTDLGPEFLEKYNSISDKLKKRFMRKPNVSEATQEFCDLANQCEQVEQPPHAGLCYIGAARCEGSVGNAIGEAEYLLMSARQFMKAEVKLNSLRCISPGKENLEAAISCYSHANKRYPENSPLKLCISLEVAENLERLGHLHEAERYYQNTLENYKNNPSNTLICLVNLSGVYIKEGKFKEALSVNTKINELAKTNNNKLYMQRSEINILFLYLIVQPSPKTISPSLEKLIERYTIDCDNDEPKIDASILNPELALCLQTVLFACKICDIHTLHNIQSEISDYLTIEQQDLLRVLTHTYESIK